MDIPWLKAASPVGGTAVLAVKIVANAEQAPHPGHLALRHVVDIGLRGQASRQVFESVVRQPAVQAILADLERDHREMHGLRCKLRPQSQGLRRDRAKGGRAVGDAPAIRATLAISRPTLQQAYFQQSVPGVSEPVLSRPLPKGHDGGVADGQATRSPHGRPADDCDGTVGCLLPTAKFSDSQSRMHDSGELGSGFLRKELDPPIDRERKQNDRLPVGPSGFRPRPCPHAFGSTIRRGGCRCGGSPIRS
jgi:hypothetical protein